MTDVPLHYRSATELARLIARGELSAAEVMRAFLARIEEVKPFVWSTTAEAILTRERRALAAIDEIRGNR